MESKLCKKCKESKPVDLFYGAGVGKNGSRKYHPYCKSCVLAYNRELYNASEEYREKRKARARLLTDEQKLARKNTGASFYKSVRGRALTLLNSAKKRSEKFNEECTVDFNFISDKLEAGVCEITGLPFDFEKPVGTKKNPYAPSIDRIDVNVGYTKENVRIVLWQVNLMRGEISDEELCRICKSVLKGLDNGLGL